MLDRLDQIIQCLNTHIVPGPYANNQARDRNPYQALGVRSGGDQLDISPASYGLENGHDKRDRDLDMDYLHIPTSQTTADQVLEWPVFAGRYPVNCLVGNLSLVSQEPSNVQALSSAGVIGLGVADEDIEDLVERFLTYVHTKNPILDPKSIRRSARRVAEDGLKWDAESCLIVSDDSFLILAGCLTSISILRVPLAASRNHFSYETLTGMKIILSLEEPKKTTEMIFVERNRITISLVEESAFSSHLLSPHNAISSQRFILCMW